LVLVLGRALQVLAGLLTIKVATTLLSPGEWGSVNQVMSLAVLGSSALLAPVATYIGRGFLEWLDEGTLHRRLGSYVRLVLAASLVLALAAWAIQAEAPLVSGVGPEWVGALVALYVVGYSLHTLATSGLNLLGHRLAYVAFGNIAAWGGLALAMYLSRGGASPETWLLGIYGGFLLSSLSYILLKEYARKTSHSRPTATGQSVPFDWWTVFMFVWPQAVVYSLWWVQSQSYRFILDRLTDVAFVGLFAGAYMVCSVPMQTFETLFNDFYSPTLYRNLKDQGDQGIVQAWDAYASAYLPAVILFGAFLAGNATFLVKLLLGERFQVVAPILILPALTETMRAMSSSLYTLGIAKIDMTINLLPVLAGGLVAPVLLYLLAPHDPLIGTGIALFVAGLVVLGTAIPMSYRVLPVTWPMRRILAALALGLPLVVGGNLASSWLSDVTLVTALVAVLIAGLFMVSLQYLIARKWLREPYAVAG
jgi:O-antigen/teichoic acid export membrane protein